MTEKIILLPNSEQHRVTVDPRALTHDILGENPDHTLQSDRNAKIAQRLFVLGFSLLMLSAVFATILDDSPFAPLFSAIGLICHTISKKLEQKDLLTKKKLALLENQNLALALHSDRLTEGEIRNPDLELIRNHGKLNFSIHSLTQILGLVMLSSSALTPFLGAHLGQISLLGFTWDGSHVGRLTPSLMQLGFILFTAGAQLEEFQDRHEKRTYRKASFDLKLEVARRQGSLTA